jgi:hypothetical protein
MRENEESMARTKMNQRSASRGTVPMGATGGRTPPSKVTIALFTTSIISALWAGAMLTPPGRIAYVYLFTYSEFYMGVLTLVSLSITVMVGLLATDRMVMSVRQRVLLQSAHRTTGIIAVAALGIHLATKLSMGRMSLLDVFIPFIAKNQTFYIGLGTIAGYLLVSVFWTGIVRARFAGRGKPWMWRSLHSGAYLAWPIALLHGLNAGRAAASWVIVSYIVCVLMVLVALAVRLSVSLGRRKDFSSTSTGSIKPVGKLVPTSVPKAKSRIARRAPDFDAAPVSARLVADRGNAPAAVLDSWVPANAPASVAPMSSAAPMSAAPVSATPVGARPADDVYRPPAGRPERYAGDERPRRRSVERDGYADEAPRSRRYVEDEAPPAPPRQRRYVEDDEMAPPPRQRRYVEDEEPAAPRQRRYVEDDAPDDTRSWRMMEMGEAPQFAEIEERSTLRARRDVDEERYDDVPRSRRHVEDDVPARRHTEPATRDRFDEPRAGRRYAAEAPVAPRASRYAADDEPIAPRARRYAEDERYDEEPRGRRSAESPRSGARAERSRPGSSRVERDDEDSGRHSRADLTRGDLTRGERARADMVPADPWADGARLDANYLPPDDTPTLIDMASRRARRATSAEPPRAASRGARRRGGRGEDAADDLYFRQLRGEAQ